MSHASHRQRSKPQNVTSKMLSNEENRRFVEMIGNRCLSLAATVVQVMQASPPSFNTWSKKCTGVVSFIKDNPRRSYFIRVYNLKTQCYIWEQEIYNQFKYKTPRPYFHTFEGDTCLIGLNFANEDEANRFKSAVQEKLQQRMQRKMERKKSQHGTVMASPSGAKRTQHSTSSVSSTDTVTPTIDSGKDTLRKKDKKKGGKKSKLTKEDIGTPTEFRHVGHVGWDPEKGFDMNNLDSDLKVLFDQAGITDQQLQDKETATFIYDFIEQHGGVQKIKDSQQQRPPPPPVVPVTGLPPSYSPSSAPAPPPPSRGHGGAAPPPPPPSRGAGVPPPPPPSRVGGPVPPPPSRGPSRGMGAPPPPPPSRGGMPPPPPPTGRPAQSPSMAPPPPPPVPSMAPPPPPPPVGAVPPPPPPVMGGGGGAPPPPPPADGRNDLLSAIRGGAQLKHVDPEQSSEGNPDTRDGLLAQIKAGKQLKKVDESATERPRISMAEEQGLAGALARALQDRNRAIAPDDDDDSEDFEEEDDDWSD